MKEWSVRVCLTNTSVDEQSTPKSRSLHKKSQNLQRATTLPHYWASRNVDLAGSILSLRAAGRVPLGSHGSAGGRHSGSSCPLGGLCHGTLKILKSLCRDRDHRMCRVCRRLDIANPVTQRGRCCPCHSQAVKFEVSSGRMLAQRPPRSWEPSRVTDASTRISHP
jgi:hypothetical protein